MARRILLADDSVTAQNMGKKILSDAGYEVVTVSNGSAALKKANELMPDIVVLDVYMPGYSGLEVCKLLKENPLTADLPILLTVGKLEPFKSEEALKARANAFVVKPFEATELLAVIRKMENAHAERKPVKAPKLSALTKTAFAGSTADAPEAQESGIEEKGWKNRLAIPAKKKAAAEPEAEVESPAMGTAFRDLTPAPAEESGLRRESAFTAEGVGPAEAPLDISPEEIAAIKAAVEVLSGEGDRAPVLHVPAAEGAVRHLAPEPEEAPEGMSGGVETPRIVEAQSVEAPIAEAAAVEPPVVDVPNAEARAGYAQSVAEVTPTFSSAPAPAHWVAEAVELTQSDSAASLEREMQEALGTAAATETFNTYSLASFAESTVAEPVDDEPIYSEVAAAQAPPFQPEAHGAALAASASGDASAGMIQPGTQPAMMQPASGAPMIDGVAGFHEMHAVASGAAPGVAPSDPSAPEDEIDSRTKSQMNAAWSNWREIRNTIVTPGLTEQLAEVATAVAKGDAPVTGEIAGHDPDSIGRIVDSVLAEMRPKLVEEIARKLAARKE